jgi:hypothetical protein
MAETSRPQIPRALNYSVSGGYAAFSTSAALIEEYLRSGGNQSRTLREAPGLLEAAEKVSDPGTGLFGYENQVEAMRATFESLKAPPAAPTPGNPSNPITGAIGLSSPEASVKDWMDFSLLPAFDRVSKYFYFTVYAGSASTEGLTFRMFAPVPPQSRAAPREWADTKAASK